MGNNLVIVESPAKAGTIQKYLGADYVVRPSFGHIRDLQEKKMGVDIENGFAPDYVVPTDKKKVVKELTDLAKKADMVWLASDEDREGEAISWHLAETLNLKKENTKRIVFHEITKPAILGAIANPRDIDMNLVNAQQARRVLDRLVGFELSPVLWRRVQRGLSAGRVQSVALRLVTDREKEIIAFKKEPYYRVTALFHPEGSPAHTKVTGSLDTKFKTLQQARKFLEDSIGANYTISSVDKKPGVRTPAAPFTTSTLQQEASRKLRFPVSLTMRIAQQLYEKGLITYMRTDSVHLSSFALNAAKEFIVGAYGEAYSKTRQYRTSSKGAQEAHEAIRPTDLKRTSVSGSEQEQSLYNLIWKRAVASQMADAKVLKTEVAINSDKRPEKFQLQATEILFDGFLKLYIEGTDDSAEDSEVILPELHVGDVMREEGINADCKYSSAPPRYSEATLVKKLEELGIGRPSTYAPTISVLTTERGYLVKGNKDGEKFKVTNLALKNSAITETVKEETFGSEKGKLFPQEIGMVVSDYLVSNFSEILDYNFTASVETDFDKVADGDLVWNDLIANFYKPFHSRVQEVLGDKNYTKIERELGTAPDGLKLVAKFGQYGPYIQKGEGEERKFAKLGQGQLIESISLEEALKLFELPRVVGSIDGVDVIATKGRFGPYIKYGDTNVSIPRGSDPLKITLEECKALIEQRADNGPIAEWGNIQVLKGRFGPYIKCDGSNYKIPAGTDAQTLSEQQCREIIESTQPSQKRPFRRKSK